MPRDHIPAEGGAYALLIRLDRPLIPDIPSFRGRRLNTGLYAYCGSAWGPGGLAARIGRHLRRDKKPRWHVDRLTAAGRVEAVAVHVGGRECDLAQSLAAAGGRTPLTGFGSTDCRRCPAHLLLLNDASAFARLCGRGPAVLYRLVDET